MKASNKILGGLAALLAAGSVHAVPVQWSVNGHWYEFVSTPATVLAARTAATSSSWMGESGYLATILSAEEQAFIEDVVGDSTLHAWFGASDAAEEGVWTWLDGPEAGEALTYTYWAPGEPNNCCGGENYAVINWNTSGQWNDWGPPAFSDTAVGYVVEYEGKVSKVPAPAPIALLGLGLIGLGYSRKR